MNVVSHTALFISSKNSEVEPMSLNDLTHYLLKNSCSPDRIIHKEMRIRHCINYENEVSTLFEFLLYYVKIWKLKCQHYFTVNKLKVYEVVYNFICEVEQVAYDLAKSVLIDSEVL